MTVYTFSINSLEAGCACLPNASQPANLACNGASEIKEPIHSGHK